MNIEDYNKAVDLYSDGVYRFILKNIKDSEKAKDIVQDTFEKLWVNAGNVNFLKVKSYIFTAAYHTMIDLIRKEKRMTDFENVREDKYSHSKQYSDLSEILNEALSKLNETQRSLIMLRDYEGYSYQEIGEITGLSEAQVKVYIFRARVFLKEYIGSVDAVI
ncbi:MAG TPA: RNA polymerase sigma factor [Marinilabiliales bacterium]|nr:RNA polymerase sigma factor [Salinivirgaceae bacterium]OFX44964.1 MAG: RNA polymerase subunit sigma-24 [Bacteroidetes bacterium GWA2_40_14]OFX58336.1 MAG: RNA polymerase subunit sigma-24 [Bacteroidetes bacterium GWC2_40_13]OFX71284.1 MAG: RNA polymerase subunit sigma-24 [Bacteroidetes bacterium GWD2_40_43]OFX88632.1 MAG: RNA polymerase subunit sigma-24 [Bacteroidetes bacterium GWE2_40_63]OFY19157.1 MAG: RNA polymerase subunit sigma-24 [Bacteroidetes bacterium GWF2_40_13]OFZ30956.1 MAG: RNA